MTDLIVLGFASRELAEEARRRSASLEQQEVIDLDGAAVAYRREDGKIELVQPLHLAGPGAVVGAASGGLIGLMLLVPLVSAAIGAVAGALGAELSAGILNARFVHDLKETLEPGRAALMLVVRDAVDPEKTVEALKTLSPTVLRASWTDEEERRVIAALAKDAG